MFDFMTVSKALTDENRVRILMALRNRELCVCQITGFLDLSPSTTSKHLSILRQARLIESRKKGKWVYYTQSSLPGSPALIKEAVAWTSRALEDSPAILEDERRIHAILEHEKAFHGTGPGCSPDTFHSLEVHSFNQDEEEAV